MGLIKRIENAETTVSDANKLKGIIFFLISLILLLTISLGAIMTGALIIK